jgi:hypothetical protein
LPTAHKVVKVLFFSASILLSTLLSARIQDPDVSAAPVPIQILYAHKIFISNGESTGNIWDLDLPYNAVYASLKKWAKYDLVSTPVEADLVFEVRYLGAVYNVVTERVQILVLDPKTHVTLAQFIEEIKGWNRPETGLKNLQSTIDALVNDVKKLTVATDNKH